ncbi:beta-amyrin 11-oxidase [Fagus crenata]
MEAEDEDSLKLEDEDITDLLLLFLTSGFDSSAISTLWAIIHLTEHPEALKKAKEEQEEIIRKRPSDQKGFNLKEIKQMEYLPKTHTRDEARDEASELGLDNNGVRDEPATKKETKPERQRNFLIWAARGFFGRSF